MQSWSSKDPDEVLDFQMNWSSRLEEGETILTSAWAVVSGTVAIAGSPAPSIAGGITTLWLTGGADGEVCKIRNRVTTSEGRTQDYTARLRIRTS